MSVTPRFLLALRSCVGAGVESTALTLHRNLGPSCWLAILENFGELQGEARALERVIWPQGGTRTESQKEDLLFALKAIPRMVSYSNIIRHHLSQFRPDVFFTHSGVDLLAATRWARPSCLWMAGIGSDVYRDLMNKHPRLRPLWLPVLRFLYSGPQHWIASSRGLASSLSQNLGVPESRLDVVANPVDLARLELGKDEPLPAGFPQDYVLGVGRLSRTKGFDRLIEAMARLPQPYNRFPLVILGEGEEREALLGLAQQVGLKRLLMPGFEANPWRYLKRARLVVVPSRLEGFSNVTVEALACGAPLVVTDCPHGPREIVEEGKFGRVAGQQVQALSQAIFEVLSQPELALHLASLGPARAKEFSAPLVAQRYLEVFQRVAGKANPACCQR